MISQAINTKTTDVFLRALSCLDAGSLALELPNGKTYQFEGNKPGPHTHLILHEFSVISNLALRGDIAFAEDYRDGHWDSPDIAALVECAILNYDALSRYIAGSWVQRFLSQVFYLFKRNSKRGSKKNIHAHYDLGNEFYSLWLDETMTYSSAIYQQGNETLASAQRNKYDRILNKFNQPSSLLEIGCGWGGFADRVANPHSNFVLDHHLKALTISDAQFQFAKNRLSGHEDKINIALEDYRDVQGKFDGIVSIEMFEAVGEKYWKTYFDKVKSLLSKEGKAVIQTITIADPHFEAYRKSGDAIRSFIFPGGMLPSPERFDQVALNSGLKTEDHYFFGKDYAKTLLTWLDNFDGVQKSVLACGFDMPFIRLWRFYLAYCAGAFNAERINVMQIELHHN